MQKPAILLILIVVTFSCQNDDPSAASANALVKKSTQFTADTNEKIGETVFSYNNADDLILEKYTQLLPYNGTIEKTFEYDNKHKVTKLVETHRLPPSLSIQPWSYTTVYEYQDDLLRRETEFSQTTVPLSRTDYFYDGGTRADSSQLFYIVNSVFTYNGANYYQYDNQGRLIRQSRRFFDGTISDILTSTYSGEQLVQTCDPFTDRGGNYPCIRNEFNSRGQLFRIFSTTPGSEGKLLEEYKYDSNGLLTERTKFDQVISQATYTDPSIHTVLEKYQY